MIQESIQQAKPDKHSKFRPRLATNLFSFQFVTVLAIILDMGTIIVWNEIIDTKNRIY